MKLSYSRFFVILILFLGLASISYADVYGYIVVRGKNQTYIDREVSTIERLISSWKNGEVLYKHVVTSGAIFFKKVTATVFFAGNQRDIAAFLTSGTYEGDYLRNVIVKYTYSSLKEENAFDGEINTTFTRKSANIRKALEAIEGKTSKSLWAYLAKTKKSEFKKHKKEGMIEPRVSVVFYSIQPIEENRLFGITYTSEEIIPERK